MSILSPRVWLQVAALLLAGGTGLLAADNPVSNRAIDPGHFTPFGPVPEFHDMEYQWFEEPDLSEYGCDRPAMNEGFFFNYDRLIWAFQSPKKIDIGDEANERVYSLPFDRHADPRSVLYRSFQNDVDTEVHRVRLGLGQPIRVRLHRGRHGLDGQHVPRPHSPQAVHPTASLQMVFNDPFLQTFGFVDQNGDNYDDDLNSNNVFGRCDQRQLQP